MRIISSATVKNQAMLNHQGKLISEKEQDLSSTIDVKQAYKKGREEGEQLKKDNKCLMALIQMIATELMEKRKNLLNQLKPELIELSLAICEKVIRQELASPANLAKLIDTYVGAAIVHSPTEEIKVYLSCEDLIMLDKEVLRDENLDLKTISFLPDDTLDRGDVRVETPSSILNGSIGRELEDLRARLLSPLEMTHVSKK